MRRGPGHTYPLPPAIKAPPSPNQRILLTRYANAKQKRAIQPAHRARSCSILRLQPARRIACFNGGKLHANHIGGSERGFGQANQYDYLLQVATDSRADADLEIRLEAFRGELGVRDEPVFRLLLEDYKAEREFRNQNLDTLLKLVKDIQEMFNSES